MAEKLTTEDFIARASAVHNNFYDYSRVEYRSAHEKVKINCPLHGLFEQRPNVHVNRKDECPKCRYLKSAASLRLTHEEFLSKARSIHGNRYDYSQAKYYDMRTPVTIICVEHGAFEQKPAKHLSRHNCPRCAEEGRTRYRTRKTTTEEFVRKARSVHGNLYNYDSVVYTTAKEKIRIYCDKHDLFEQEASSHLSRHGCPVCSAEEASKNMRLSREEFIEAAIACHGNKYDYSKVEYGSAIEPVEIVCISHGSFWQTAGNHIHNGGSGCPSCVHRHSKPHREIEALLTDLGIEFKSNTRAIITPLELDIYLPAHKIAIEFNGRFWHSLDGTEPSSDKYKHRIKYERCVELGITLLQIDEHEWRDPVKKSIWISILRSKLGLHTRIAARRTTFSVIDSKDARAFLDAHHLQGAAPGARWAFGLYYETELVGVLTFTTHEKRGINLNRLAFKQGLTIVGGAQKLFKNALSHLPLTDITTFSHNQYSLGGIYSVLGFHKDADLQPSYQWYFRNEVLNKRHCRHSKLPALLGDDYDPRLTEHQNMYRAGARCLYDAGYQRWVYRRPSAP